MYFCMPVSNNHYALQLVKKGFHSWQKALVCRKRAFNDLKGHSQTTLTRFWLFLTNYPHCVDIFYGMNVDKKWTFWITYLPRLVNVVCERPLKYAKCLHLIQILNDSLITNAKLKKFLNPFLFCMYLGSFTLP